MKLCNNGIYKKLAFWLKYIVGTCMVNIVYSRFKSSLELMFMLFVLPTQNKSCLVLSY